MIDTVKLNAKQKQIYEQFKDDPDFDMEKALEKFAKPAAAVRKVRHVKDTNESVSRELRAVIEFLHRRIELVQRKCIVCSRTFAADYLYVALCSDSCRADHIYREYGIIWDDTKSERERWDGEPPSVIKPQTLEQLKTFAKAILDLPTSADYIERRVSSPSGLDNSAAVALDSTSPREDLAGKVKEVKASSEAQNLKAKLDAGEITAIEYQLALADLF